MLYSIIVLATLTTYMTLMKLIRDYHENIIYVLKGAWNTIKAINTWRGRISLLLTWSALSGVLTAIIGFIIGSKALITASLGVIVMWAGPGTPLIPLVILISLVIQRFVFMDKSVSLNTIKDSFKKVRSNDSNENND